MLSRAAVFVFSVVMALATPAFVPMAVADDPVRDAVPGTISRLGLQTELPYAAADDSVVSGWDFDPPHALIWVAAAVFAGILVYIASGMIPGWRRRDDDGWADGAVAGAAGDVSPEASLADADALAVQDRFVEAMHLLLLHSLAEIRRRLRLEFADSLTSREILRRARLPEDGTAALRGIVTRVELSYFGDHPAARPDYDVCRVRYQELNEILARSSPMSNRS